MEWDAPAWVPQPGDLDERLRAGAGRTTWLQVLIDHDTPVARGPGCGWATTSSRRDCPSRVIAKALLERKPLPVWLEHLAPVLPGARVRPSAQSVEQRRAVADAETGLFDAPQRVSADGSEGR